MPSIDPSAFLGKNIKDIFPNGFNDPTLNHCAHFASHVAGLDFSTNCRDLKGGKGAPANVRVHEVFAHCPKVGKWDDADLTRTQLMFVTRAANVDLATKTMINIPKKHVGIYRNGLVYNYSNTQDKVVADTPQEFMEKFDHVYGPGQGYFFGWLPNEDLLLNISTTGTAVSATRKFALTRADTTWRAKETGEASDFLVGKEVNQPARNFFGLVVPVPQYWGPVFSGDDYLDRIDHWAYLLEATGYCESQNHFLLVNTYDRAKFTFGFYQLAAHTPDDNLILLFHALAKLPRFKDYFPDLELRNGRLCRIDSSGTSTDLETPMSTGPGGEQNLQMFMNYLNPNRKLIDEQEVLMAARMIHWALHDPAALDAQVVVSASILQSKMAKRHNPKLGLDGKSDVICAIVCDMLHNGRARYAELKPILASANPIEALLTFKNDDYASRNQDLRTVIDRLRTAGKLGNKVYRAATNEFI